MGSIKCKPFLAACPTHLHPAFWLFPCLEPVLLKLLGDEDQVCVYVLSVHSSLILGKIYRNEFFWGGIFKCTKHSPVCHCCGQQIADWQIVTNISPDVCMSQCLSIQIKVTCWQTALLGALVKGKLQCEKMNLNRMYERAWSALKLNSR